MNKALVFVLIAEVLMTAGQVCFKKTADVLKGTSPLFFIISALKNRTLSPILVLGLGGFAMLSGLVFWLAALNSGELSFVYLLGSMQYIFALLSAHFFLQEKINISKLAGTLLISLGVIVTALSGQLTFPH
jgi:drug/metabolite transporter (DMT)-like permease